MLHLTFDRSFAATLSKTCKDPVLALPPDLQFGDLTRLSGAETEFYAFKSAHLGLGQWPEQPSATQLQAADAQAIAKLQSAIANGEDLQIWWTDVPDDIVGLWWLADLLKSAANTVTQVHVPTVLPHPTQPALFNISHLGELDPAWMTRLTETGTLLTPRDLQAYALGWQGLQSAPGDLRVWLNGQLLGMSETYYDGLLADQPTPQTFPQRVRLIGQLMGQYPVGLPDWWWDARISAVLD